MGRESGHPAGRAGGAPPALSRPMATEWTPALHESILTSAHVRDKARAFMVSERVPLTGTDGPGLLT